MARNDNQPFIFNLKLLTNFMSILNFLYNPSKRVIGNLEKKVAEINDLEEEIKKLTDEELKDKTGEFKNKFTVHSSQFTAGQEQQILDEITPPIDVAQGVVNRQEQDKIIDELTPVAFAVLREAMRRGLGERHFEVPMLVEHALR